MEGCVFCKIVQGQIPCFKVYEDERVLAFADINPITRGHTLIIPKAHAENLWEIAETDLLAVQRASKRIAAAIRASLKCDGIACLQLNGRAVNQVVMHYHFHLIPRWNTDPELKMTAWELSPGNMDEIRQTAATIAGALT
jgi:histidine triad (HIT) family protein